MTPMSIASARYSRMMSPTWAPSAFFKPISLTRSLTAMIIVFTTDRPPMMSASRAAAVMTAVKIVLVDCVADMRFEVVGDRRSQQHRAVAGQVVALLQGDLSPAGPDEAGGLVADHVGGTHRDE